MTLSSFEARYEVSQRCCFTGHRSIPKAELAELKQKLLAEIENLINRGVVAFISGGALGFDTMAALSVLELKSKYPFIRLVMALPCISQPDRWSDKDRAVYNDLLNRADVVHYVNQTYEESCMFRRNDYMVNFAGVCVCYLRHDHGGTAYTVGYAKRLGRELIKL